MIATVVISISSHWTLNFRLLDESSRKLESKPDLRSILSWVTMLVSSIRAESWCWYRVLESSQKVGMKTRLDDQSNHEASHEASHVERIVYSTVWRMLCIRLTRNLKHVESLIESLVGNSILRRVFGRKFGRAFDIESWRVLSIELVSMCYEAYSKHTMK